MKKRQAMKVESTRNNLENKYFRDLQNGPEKNRHKVIKRWRATRNARTPMEIFIRDLLGISDDIFYGKFVSPFREEE